MASRHETKRRMKAVSSTRQITKAMEMVAAVKMRKSQALSLVSRPYAREALGLLDYLLSKTTTLPSLMVVRSVSRKLVVLIASDRGFAGAFNTNVFRAFDAFLAKESDVSALVFAAVGKKAREYLERRKLLVSVSFFRFGDFVDRDLMTPLFDWVVGGYTQGQWDRVTVVSGHFRTTLKQRFEALDVLPLGRESIQKFMDTIIPESGKFSEYESPAASHTFPFEFKIEPSAEILLESISRNLVDLSLYYLILHANAAEHSARVLAMNQASENAKEVGRELSLQYNKMRQGAITQEIMEIVAGSMN
ncbi:MAG: F-type H+-transporting ATPase subunit gamma [Parcubacteria group bacterium Gr01-1014_18]|nr:MAG: F-type H+-transporting ATPase subunit gamma [Parcubacteria group bacterium Greene0416_36]TSC80853.1 MAG: F-type H+-transporting ATPase subunit gamma [Parcubacteria group bacterium Gr01-1014_18]TSC99514.1 MAG: F-type H+-transporting ATPase subunit gamma [Parcubacteria group bacterium Greene1014_20]TSD07567.1 MAG: F-type H+-transporting ATPase subunit gamma [Parcubacteria group bacterium Greene0714_2]